MGEKLTSPYIVQSLLDVLQPAEFSLFLLSNQHPVSVIPHCMKRKERRSILIALHLEGEEDLYQTADDASNMHSCLDRDLVSVSRTIADQTISKLHPPSHYLP